jgi:HK97 family phage prohead protease
MVLGNSENNTLKVWEDEIGLRFELELPDTTAGKDALTLIQRGDVKGVSFGFRTRVDEWDESDRTNVIRTLVDVVLYEVSPTSMPAYPQTSVAARSIQDIYTEHRKDVEQSKQRNIETRERAARIRLNQIKLMETEVK